MQDYSPDAPKWSTIEDDDIPEPHVPGDLFREEPEMAVQPMHTQAITHMGHQYVDHPSTLYIKRHIGQTELMWTFRGENDMETWNRAINMIKLIDKAAPAPPPQPQAESAQTQQSGQAPMCPTHNQPMAVSQYGGWYCKRKDQNGDYCKQKVRT